MKSWSRNCSGLTETEDSIINILFFFMLINITQTIIIHFQLLSVAKTLTVKGTNLLINTLFQRNVYFVALDISS